jgi:hypothetical protein
MVEPAGQRGATTARAACWSLAQPFCCDVTARLSADLRPNSRRMRRARYATPPLVSCFGLVLLATLEREFPIEDVRSPGNRPLQAHRIPTTRAIRLAAMITGTGEERHGRREMPDVRQMTGGPLGAAVMQRIQGEKPGAFRAIAGATVGAAATSVLLYKLLRR